MGTEPFVGGYPAPSGSGASGVWSSRTVQLYSGSDGWPQPTNGFWTFVGDLESTGSPIGSYYSEGGVFQTAAQVSAGNNEYTIIARTTDQTGITGSAVAVLQGLRINGSSAPSSTVSYNKGFWWQYSDGVSLNAGGDVWYEDSSGNFYLAFSGYVGGSYNPPRHHGRLVKLNSSLVVQWSQAYTNNPSLNQGVQKPIINEINGDLAMMFMCHVSQASSQSKPLAQIAKIDPSNGNISFQSRIIGAGHSYTADQLQSYFMINKNKNPGSNNDYGYACVRYYGGTSFSPGGGWNFPGNHQRFQIFKYYQNGSTFAPTTMDATWYNRSSSTYQHYDLTPADFDTKDDTDKTFVLGTGAAQSVVDSSTKYFVMFGEYEFGQSEGSADAWIMKLQTGGKNENMYAMGMCLDLANSCIYMHGYATNIGATNAALVSTWIAKIPCSADGIPTGSVDWINSYCHESYGVYPKEGRNGLVLTPNNTITSYGWTQTTSGSGTPACLSLITVPIDGSSKGSTGTVDGMSVSSHDISSYVLFQHESASTNCDVGFSLSGTANMSMNNSYTHVNTTTAGTQYDTQLTSPSTTEYESGGV